jgi:hypothetical protein
VSVQQPPQNYRLSADQIYAVARQAGFDPQAAITATAIALAESGGSVGAHGDVNLQGTGSWGLWQVYSAAHPQYDYERMATDPLYAAQAAFEISGGGKNWNPWTTYWGPNRNAPAYRGFLGSAQQAAQEVDQAGQDFTGAHLSEVLATIPYGGNPPQAQATTGATVSTPPPTGSGQINLGLGGGQVAGTGVSTQGGSNAANQGEVPSYGWMQALHGIPEIGAILDQAALENWSADKLQAEITGTQWWRTTEPTVRQWIALQASDPAGAQQQVTQLSGAVKRMGGALGISLSDTQSATIAEQALKLGWDPSGQEIKNAIIGEANLNPGTTPEGTIGTSMEQVKQLASSYLVPISDQQAQDFALRIARGEITQDAVQVHFANTAKQRFPWLQGEIDAGFTPADTFDSQKQAIAQTLEIDPETIDFAGDSKWWPVIDVVDPKGNHRGMTISEATRWAKGLDDYQYTDAARSQAYNLTGLLEQTFGQRK